MNEWVTVRREERAIYTHRQNLTVQIYVRSFDTDRQNFQRLLKTLFKHEDSWASLAKVGTPNESKASGLSMGVGAPSGSQDF